MNVTTAVKRAGLVAAAAAAVLAASPLAANADVSGAAKPAPGGKYCVQQSAAYRVRADGTATNQGAFFTIESGGLVRANSSTATAANYGAELFSPVNFPGPGTYKVC